MQKEFKEKNYVVLYNTKAKKSFYNVDYLFLLKVIVEWLKDEGVGEKEIVNFRNLFDENTAIKFLDNWLFLLSCFRYYDLVGEVHRQFYVQIMYRDIENNKYFQINSIGFNLEGIDKLLTGMVREELFDSVAKINYVEQVAYGTVNCRKKKKELKEQGYETQIFGKK